MDKSNLDKVKLTLRNSRVPSGAASVTTVRYELHPNVFLVVRPSSQRGSTPQTLNNNVRNGGLNLLSLGIFTWLRRRLFNSVQPWWSLSISVIISSTQATPSHRGEESLFRIYHILRDGGRKKTFLTPPPSPLTARSSTGVGSFRRRDQYNVLLTSYSCQTRSFLIACLPDHQRNKILFSTVFVIFL